MANMDELNMERGREFNTHLHRTDGEFVSKMLHGRLEQDLRVWLYERIFHIFDGVPLSEWSKDDQMTSEWRSRNEISCIQSIESAIFVRDLNYLPKETIDWFVAWCFRVNLGSGAEYAQLHRLPVFWNADEKKRLAIFSVHLSKVFPDADRSLFFIHLYAPLLLHATKATVATVFSDHATANKHQAEYHRLDLQLQTIIQQVTSGGGTCFVIENDKGVVTTKTSQYGRLFHIWTDENLAKSYRKQFGQEHAVNPMNYRELGPLLTQMKNIGITSVTIDLGSDSDFRIVPISELILSVQESITIIDSSELGKAFLNGFQSN